MKKYNHANFDLRATIKEVLFFKQILFIIALFVLISCERFVEIDLPESQLAGEAVFEDPFTTEAAMVDIYARLRQDVLLQGGFAGISNLMGNYSDELTYYSNAALVEEDFYRNNLIPANPTISSLWKESYNLIYAANAIIEGVENSSSLTANDKNLYKGEALFTRALIHFYLVNLFGDIPYIRTTDYRENTNVPRNPVMEVYENIISDLENAKILLPEKYIVADRTRPNKWTASALLARTYLYAQDWKSAEAESSAIINNTNLFKLETNLNEVFLINSSSTIWQFKAAADGVNTLEAQTFIFSNGPPPNRALSNDLVNSFSQEDLRKTNWIGKVGDSIQNWFYAYKYKIKTNTGSSEEYSIVFRLAEQYLIRAEARAREGDLAGALQDLNKIRDHAGLENIKIVSQEELIDLILQERRHEFFTEFGHRFFDLKRTGRADGILSTKAGWNLTDVLLPIPESEILLNPKLLPQNPGY